MIATWMLYTVLLGICSVTAALALEPLARTRDWPPCSPSLNNNHLWNGEFSP